MKKSLLRAVLLFVSFPCICYAGPFGLDAGMSRAEVIQRIGKSAILQERGDSVLFSSVPTRSDYFDSYDCYFDRNGKLDSIYASSKILATRSHGEDLRSSFDRLKVALDDKYGKSLYVTGSASSEERWVNGLQDLHPYTEAIWDGDADYSKSSHIESIQLRIRAVDKDHGALELRYAFNTWIEDPL